VRRHAALLLAVLALVGCGGDGETTTVTIATTVGAAVPLPPTPPALPSPLPEDGTLPVDEFNAYTEDLVQEPWERDPGSVLAAFVDAGAIDAASRSFESTSRDEGTTATATLVLDGLFDDSVRARRYDAELRRRADMTWELVSATWAQRCRAGRGHQDFSPELCV
jgi:hypothetical protein